MKQTKKSYNNIINEIKKQVLRGDYYGYNVFTCFEINAHFNSYTQDKYKKHLIQMVSSELHNGVLKNLFPEYGKFYYSKLPKPIQNHVTFLRLFLLESFKDKLKSRPRKYN